MKPYGRDKKVLGSGSWKKDYHLKRLGCANWWENMCDFLTRSRIKQIVQKDITNEILDVNEQELINNKAIEHVKNHINYPFELIEYNLKSWKHLGFVEVEKYPYKDEIYPSYDFFVEKDNTIKYRQQCINGNFHVLLYESEYWSDDDICYALFPLINGKYWKISYINY